MPSYRQNKSEADILMNSMRSMGYTFESAIADILSKTLAIRLLEDGKRISTGVGRKLGTYITGYAHQYLAEKSIRNTHRYLSMRPFPFHLDLTDEDKVVYRKLM